MGRYREILAKAAFYGFGDRIEGLFRIPRRLFGKKRSRDMKNATDSERLRMLLEELGPTFVKLGQMLSHRPDVLPRKLIKELKSLQECVPSFPSEEARRILEEDLGKPPEKLFNRFNDDPVASASIAQVHQAEDFEGNLLAIKIQRPGIGRIVSVDLEILNDLARLADRHLSWIKPYKPLELLREFERIMTMEMDFSHEKQMLNLFRETFNGRQGLQIPAAREEFCSRRVLAMDFVQGISLNRLLNQKEKCQYDLKLIAQRGVRYVLSQIFTYGFYNADPHGGNFMILKDNTVVPLDFGMVGFLDDELKEALFHILMAFIRKDSGRLLRVFSSMHFIDDSVDMVTLKNDFNRIIHYYYYLSVGQLSAARMLEDLNYIIHKYKMNIPGELVMTMRVLMTIEGLAVELDPDFNLVKEARPFISRNMWKGKDSRQKWADLQDFYKDSGQLIREFPYEANMILRKLRTGSMKINFHVDNLSGLVNDLDKSFNRLAFSVVIAGLLIGSSFVMGIESPWTFMGFPVIGLAGYGVSGIMGLGLLVSIIRSRRL